MVPVLAEAVTGYPLLYFLKKFKCRACPVDYECGSLCGAAGGALGC